MDNPYLDQVMMKIAELDAQQTKEISDIILIASRERVYRMGQYWMYLNGDPAFWLISGYTIQIIRTTDLAINDAIIISSRGITKFKFTDATDKNSLP